MVIECFDRLFKGYQLHFHFIILNAILLILYNEYLFYNIFFEIIFSFFIKINQKIQIHTTLFSLDPDIHVLAGSLEFVHSCCKVNNRHTIIIHTIAKESLAFMFLVTHTHSCNSLYNKFIFPYSICDRIVFSKYYVPIEFLYLSTHNVPSKLFDS